MDSSEEIYIDRSSTNHIIDYLLRISKSLQRIRKAKSEKCDRMYTYFKEIDYVLRFALNGCVAKIWKSSVHSFKQIRITRRVNHSKCPINSKQNVT